MSFSGGVTASFSMIAFSKDVCTRKVTIFGTKVGRWGLLILLFTMFYTCEGIYT